MRKFLSFAVLLLIGAVAVGAQMAVHMGSNDQFVIFHHPGKNWNPNLDFFEQPGIGAHVVHYMNLRQEGLLSAGGPFLDKSGGMMIAAPGQKLEELEAFAANDPAVKSGVLTVSIKPWRMKMKAAEIKYYYGSAETLSPSSGEVYESTFSLVKRVVSPDDETIFEEVIQPNKDSSMPGNKYLVTMQRIGTTSNFQVMEAHDAFSGEMAFSGAEWAWDKWDYKIDVPGGGKMSGSGHVDSKGIHTQKAYFSNDGTIQVKIVEELGPIDIAEYLQRRNEMLKE